MPTIGDSTRTRPFDGRDDGRGSRLGDRERRRGGHGAVRRVGARAHGDAHPRLLDRHLADAGLLDDAHDLADALGAGLVDRRELVLVGARAAADVAEQPLGVVAEEPHEQQLFLARRHALRLGAELLQRRRGVLLRLGIVRELDRADDRRVDRLGRHAEAAGDERAQLVDDRQVAARATARSGAPATRAPARSARRAAATRLRRGCGRAPRSPRRAGRLHPAPAASRRRPRRGRRGGRAAPRARRCAARAGRRARRRCARRRRRRRIPERADVDARVEAHADERLRERLARDAVQGQREREDRAGDELRAGACGREASRRARCRPSPARRCRPAARSPRRFLAISPTSCSASFLVFSVGASALTPEPIDPAIVIRAVELTSDPETQEDVGAVARRELRHEARENRRQRRGAYPARRSSATRRSRSFATIRGRASAQRG